MKSGITLIALIITIIVLLILAGITISLVVGDNGVLNQAVNAADETNRANVQTELEMAVSAVVADWSGARYVNGSNETLEDYMTIGRVESNMNTTDYNLKEFELNTENGVTVGYKGKDYKFTVEITSSGNSAKVIYEGNSESSGGDTGDEGERFADVVTDASHYGDYVEYPIDLDEDGDLSNDWRIFYNDGEHIFIIASDYVKNTSNYLNNTGTGMTADPNSTYRLYWNSAPSITQDTSKATLFGQTLWIDYSTNESGRCVSTLLNINNWVGFVDSTYAEYAIGGPTIEMWIESYNSKGYTSLYCNNIDSFGYCIGNTNKPTSANYDLSKDVNTGYGDTLYFPHQETVSNCWGYWLASPNSGMDEVVMGVSFSGSVGGVGYYSRACGVRPLVCLNSEVTATQDEDTGVWKLSI